MSDKYIRNKDKIFDELMHNYELFGTSNYNMLCDTFNESNEKLLMLKEIFDEFNLEDSEIIFNFKKNFNFNINLFVRNMLNSDYSAGLLNLLLL